MAGTQALFLFLLTQLRVTLKAITPPRTCPQFSKRLPRKHKSSSNLGAVSRLHNATNLYPFGFGVGVRFGRCKRQHNV
eukprot:g82691.t1